MSSRNRLLNATQGAGMRREFAATEPSEFVISSLPPTPVVVVDHTLDEDDEITTRYSTFPPEAISRVRHRNDPNAVTLTSANSVPRHPLAWPSYGTIVVSVVVLVALMFDASAIGVAGLAFMAIGAVGIWSVRR